MITDEEFLRQIAQDYPNEDWANVPDPITLPDIYTVSGFWLHNGREEGFQVHAEFKTIEEAQVAAERCKTWKNVKPETIKIEAGKPMEAISKHFAKECIEQIQNGEKVFPIYLP